MTKAEYLRGNTWELTVNYEFNGVKQDLRGFKVYLTIKAEPTDPDTDPADTTALLKFDYEVANGVSAIYDYPISIHYSNTNLEPGNYYMGIQIKTLEDKIFEWVSKIGVKEDITNRTA